MKPLKKSIHGPNISISLGWREWVFLPLHDNLKLKAKIDTGARGSSIQAKNIEVYNKGCIQWIRFNILHPKSSKCIETRLLCYKKIKNSFGDSEVRPVVRLKIKIGEEIWNTDISLANRSGLTYPMLIGRNTLHKKHIIHSHRSYLAGS